MTSASSSVLVAGQRAWQQWFDDGLSTLVTGISCLLLAFFLLYDRSQSATPLSIGVSCVSLLLSGAVLLRRCDIVEWLKTKIVYPRTGYALPPYFTDPLDLSKLSLSGAEGKRPVEVERVHADRKRRKLVTGVIVSVATLAMMLIQNRWICTGTGIVTSLSLWAGLRKDQRLTWIVLLGLPLVGFYMTIFFADHVIGLQRVAYFLVGAGALFVLDGAFTLVCYLYRNPRPGHTQS